MAVPIRLLEEEFGRTWMLWHLMLAFFNIRVRSNRELPVEAIIWTHKTQDFYRPHEPPHFDILFDGTSALL
ncbi:hypothetical protein Syun_017311 [Stephania yunnanensis]|uniref:Uncharacterized protein n=1 Tax=Stephania yunnanensis TaxID=152371 RepID=A0AAP0P390_9MAGN